ncbi:MAG TPA: ABC transporter substrate-binding protein [Verrucomicrobiae bacterium]|nr:ABC transporter substrate-binding protein [Verrucomicrobiae bacterium]
MRISARHGLLALSAAVALAASAGGAALAAAPRASSPHGVATFADPPGNYPTYILPIMSAAFESNVNLYNMDEMLWRPLYWFGSNGSYTVNYKLSLGRQPVFSNGGRTVTVSLNHYTWADGRAVTNRDVEFWMNEILHNEADWFAFVPGGFPSDVTGMSFPAATPDQFSITFNKAYNHTWVLYNELSQIWPIPQHAWDKTSGSGSIGNYDRTAKGAAAVYAYLAKQAQIKSSYATNPLWKVTDGPWQLSSYTPTTGYAAFTPSPHYTGPVHPKIATLEELPFTNDQSEFDALRSGSVDYGYLPTQLLTQRKALASHGYSFSPWTEWGFNWFPLNYNNPAVGSMFKQLYIRQALQRLIDQPALIKSILGGNGSPTYGPVPTQPKTNLLSSDERSNPYPYSVSAARNLLRRHGWSIHSGGTDTCRRPGTGASECGAGIKKGAQLSFTMQYANGYITFNAMMAAIRSSWSGVGINVTLTQASTVDVLTAASSCHPPASKGCQWQMENWGNEGYAWTYSPDFYPTGGEIFQTGALSNFGGYDNPINDANITATHLQQGTAAFYRYENYLATQLPVLYLPFWSFQYSEISSKLHGALPQDPNVHITPENWSLSG